MLLKILEVGEAPLRTPARPLTKEELRGSMVTQLIELMRETMRDAPGVGLAAPQVGESLQLVVIEDRIEYQQGLSPEDRATRGRVPVPFHVLVNPSLEVLDATPAAFVEGCLSLPGLVAEVPRAKAVRVQALNHLGEPIDIQARGWYARILQHELDHLQGTLYVDRMRSWTLSTVHPRHRRG